MGLILRIGMAAILLIYVGLSLPALLAFFTGEKGFWGSSCGPP